MGSEMCIRDRGAFVLSLDACPPKSMSTSIKIRHSFWPDSSGATLVERNYTPSSQFYIVKLSKRFETAFVDVARRSKKLYETNGCQVARRFKCEFGAMPAMIRKPSRCLPAMNPCPEVYKSLIIPQLAELQCSEAFARDDQARGG